MASHPGISTPVRVGKLLADHPLFRVESASATGRTTGKSVQKEPTTTPDARPEHRLEVISFPIRANEQYKAIVRASRQKRVKDISMRRIVLDLSDMIQRVFATVGLEHTVKAREAYRMPEIVRELAGYLHRDFRFFSMADVQLVLDYGATGQYGDFGYLHERTIFRWLKSYRQKRSEILRVQNRHEVDESKREGSQSLKQVSGEALCQLLEREYREFAATGIYSIEDYGNARYHLLHRLELLESDRVKFALFLEQAAASCSAQATEPVSDKQIECVARELALKAFFEQLKSQGSDLGVLLDRAKNKLS